ncbi:transcriptional regulator, Sir2 family [Opisthorchis viverrini]|uniref:protein acetyllysine N-acetyltransferase n=1 Tax=Opisthorchis viverrini TaxID=6198 RepID=A0A1S8WPQ6_OPIVI|nr:transcriptional regulator, Sir2 family [Opisthorchis viverrini]
MSVDYASGLSEYANKGVCGLPEFFDDTTTLESKIDELYRLMVESAYTVVHTGAGISTSVGIPDFRGPKGVWTLEKLGEKPTVSVSFEKATPSLAHRILVELERKNLIHYLITQNIDGLHFRSGFPRNRLSILHGDMFLEKTKLSKRANLNIHAPADVVLDAIAKRFHLVVSSTVPSSDIFVPTLLLR